MTTTTYKNKIPREKRLVKKGDNVMQIVSFYESDPDAIKIWKPLSHHLGLGFDEKTWDLLSNTKWKVEMDNLNETVENIVAMDW